MPVLGYVYAEDEFEAVRKAEVKGVYRKNITFQAVAVKCDEAPSPNKK